MLGKNIILPVILILCFSLFFIIQGCFQSKTDSLIKKLNNRNQTVREQAEAELIKIGKPAVEPLISVLSEQKSPLETRQRAVRILGEIKDERAIPILISSLGDIQLSTFAGGALRKIGPPAIDKMLSSMKSSSEDVYIAIIDVLGDTKERKAIKPLTEIVFDKNSPVNAQEHAREALKKINNDTLPSDILIYDLETSSDLEVRLEAVTELKRKKDAQAMKKLFDILGKSKDEASIILLLTWYSQETSPHYKKEIVKALSKIGDKRVSPICARFINNEKESAMAEKWLASGSPALQAAAKKWIDDKASFMNDELAVQWLNSKSFTLRNIALNWIKSNFNAITIEGYLNSEYPVVKEEALKWVKARTLRLTTEEAEQWLNSSSPLLKSQAMRWVESVQLDLLTAERWLRSTSPVLSSAGANYLNLVKFDVDKETAQRWLNSDSHFLRNAAVEWAKKHGFEIEKK